MFPLTSVAVAEMKRHTLFGEEALRRTEQKLGKSTFLRHAREIAGSHQEKWDGTGYPRGLAGDAIPVSGRLMALADVYDALISKRVYKPPMPNEKAVAIIREGRGAHFDPDVVDAFLALEETFRNIALTFADYDEEREALGGSDAWPGSGARCVLYEVTLALYSATIEPGQELSTRRVQAFRWVRSDELERYPFPAADQKTTDALLGIQR